LIFPVLFALLLSVYYPSFKNPPRSDYWSAYYVFQNVGADPDRNWTEILTFDLWRHGTFRPLSHLVPYLEHRFFSPVFAWNHILNFAGYFLSIVLLYLLARRLRLDRAVALIFLTLFAFLFSHSDIVTWTFQLFGIMGFNAMAAGFILYLGYLDSGRRSLLVGTGALFLFGMLCSEAYAAWPLGVVVLLMEKKFSGHEAGNCRKSSTIMLMVIYMLYSGAFALHRSGSTTTGPVPLPGPGLIVEGLALTFFNLLYNGVLVNLWPWLSLPLYYNDNVNLGGILLVLGPRLEGVAFWAGIGAAVLTATGLWLTVREGKRRVFFLLLFLLYLYVSNFLIVAVARLHTNGPLYPLSQFRYQYVPNALLALAAAAIFGGLFRLKKRGKIVLGAVLLSVLAANMAVSSGQIRELNRRLAPMGIVLANIRQGLEEGWISEERPLFIAEEVPELLPSPSWNRGMARFMEGNLQWFFPAETMGKFTLDRSAAAWEIVGESFPGIRPASDD